MVDKLVGQGPNFVVSTPDDVHLIEGTYELVELDDD